MMRRVEDCMESRGGQRRSYGKEELLDALFSMQSVSYQGEVGEYLFSER
jgi:hypothetical protein